MSLRSHLTVYSRGVPLRPPIRTNLRMAEFECEFSKHLPRPWRSLRLEENGLLMLALLPASCWRETLRWFVSAQTGASSPHEHVWHTTSPSPQYCSLAQTRREALVAHCSPLAFPSRSAFTNSAPIRPPCVPAIGPSWDVSCACSSGSPNASVGRSVVWPSRYCHDQPVHPSAARRCRARPWPT